MNTRRTIRQITALASSAVLTLAILASMDFIATQPAPDGLMARVQPATHVVVITGKRVG